MQYLGIEYNMKHTPKLDPQFVPFGVWRTAYLKDAKKPLTSGDVKELLEKGCVKKTGLRSAKTHTKYDATLHLDYNADGKPILRPTFD